MTGRIPLRGDDYHRDPHTLFEQLLETGPVHPVAFPAVDAWLVTGYDAAVRALNDERLGKNHTRANANWHAKASIMPEPQHSQLQVHLLHQDPPRHTVMRALVAEAFTPRRSEALRGPVRGHVRDLLDELAARSGAGTRTADGHATADLVADFAALLPFRVLVDAIGLPADLAARFDPTWGGVVSPVGPDHPGRAHYEGLLHGLQGFIADVVAAFSGGAGDRDTLLARLVAAHEDGTLAREELDSIIFQLLAAGQEPVTNQIAMAVLTLLRHPDALEHLRANPDGIDRAVEELLRFESAFGLTTWRFFLEDSDLEGTRVPGGDSVIVSLLAANRDPAKFTCPHALDLDRSPNPHLAFGHGIHFCPGAPLARIQLQEALTAILRRLPGLRLGCDEADLEFLHAALSRGVRALPIEFQEVLP